MNNWGSGLIEWIDDDTAYLSVVFSWQLQQAYQRAVWYRQMGYNVHAGGPAVNYQPDFLADVAQCRGSIYNTIARHNPEACFTTIGCPNACPFCIVGQTEGEFRELKHFRLGRIVCDNNFLASSRRHFDFVVDGLKAFKNVDFNQGLDARLLTSYHAKRLAELHTECIRLAWDNTNYERDFMAAFETLVNAGFSQRKIRVYVLIGYRDTPEDALYRLQTVKKLGARPNPMRYQPLDSQKRNEYVAPGWTDGQLKRYMRYWSRQAWLEHIPFGEYQHTRCVP